MTLFIFIPSTQTMRTKKIQNFAVTCQEQSNANLKHSARKQVHDWINYGTTCANFTHSHIKQLDHYLINYGKRSDTLPATGIMSCGKMSDGLSTIPVDDGQTSDVFQHRKISDGLSTILYYKLPAF
jgi:hypothetical protein